MSCHGYPSDVMLSAYTVSLHLSILICFAAVIIFPLFGGEFTIDSHIRETVDNWLKYLQCKDYKLLKREGYLAKTIKIGMSCHGYPSDVMLSVYTVSLHLSILIRFTAVIIFPLFCDFVAIYSL